LEEQVANLKREIASMRQESSAEAGKVNEIQEAQQNHSDALSHLDQKITAHQTSLNSITSRVDQKRMEFTATNRKTEEIGPGMFLTIKRVDAGKQEVDGSLRISSEPTELPFRAQGVQRPMMFYNGAGTGPLQLVFTNVTKNNVSGYVVMP